MKLQIISFLGMHVVRKKKLMISKLSELHIR